MAWLTSSDFNIALRNIFRQRARTALTLSVIAAGVAGLVLSGGFIEHALNLLRESTIHAQVGHLQIYRKGFLDEGKKSPFKFLIDRPDDVRTVADALPGVRQSMSRLGFAAVLNNGKSDLAVLGEGIESTKEALLGTEIRTTRGRPLRTGDRYGIVIGEGVAAAAGVDVGSAVTLLLNTQEGALNSLEFTVLGVFRTASRDYDARAVRVQLKDAQELLASEAVNAIVVELDRTAATDAIAATLRSSLDVQRYEVRTWFELADLYEKTAALFKRQFAFLQTIILLSVLLSVANSVNITIFERTGEFGTLMALGTRRSTILRLVILENAFVGLIGSAAGIAGGIALAALINALQIEMPPPPNSNAAYSAGILIDRFLLLGAFAVGCLATPLTAVLPARRISRIAVVDALRMN